MSLPPSPSPAPRTFRASPFARPSSPAVNRTPSTVRAAPSPGSSPTKPRTPSPLSPIKNDAPASSPVKANTPSLEIPPPNFGSALRNVSGTGSVRETPEKTRPLHTRNTSSISIDNYDSPITGLGRAGGLDSPLRFSSTQNHSRDTSLDSPAPLGVRSFASKLNSANAADGFKPESASNGLSNGLGVRPSAVRTASNISTSTITPASTLPRAAPAPATARPAIKRLPTGGAGNDALSSLPPQLLHSMRESFAVLDRSNNGVVTREDVGQMLEEIGLPSNASTLSAYFPPGSDSINLATFLGSMSEPLGQLDRPDELLAAFAAFDGDDSGQIDVSELRTALHNLVPEPGDKKLDDGEIEEVLRGFMGRRREGRALGRGEVFRYNEFVNACQGVVGESGTAG